MAEVNGNGSVAVTVAVYAALTYDIISATNSSPQTTEINAGARAETLMKWVKIGLVQAAGFAVLGILLDKRHWPSAVGAGIAMALLWGQYVHAKNAGLKSTQPGTEGQPPPMPGFTFGDSIGGGL